MALNETELQVAVILDLDRLLGITGELVFRHLSVHKQAIPQYTKGYKAFLKKMADLEAAASGLFLAGHYRNGISVSDSITSGLGVAERISASLLSH